MQLSEKEIEDYIFDDLVNNCGAALHHRGLTTFYNSIIPDLDSAPHIKWLRQLELGPYGRLDIIGYYRIDNCVHIELFELKSVAIKVDDFEQICRYEHAIKEYLKNHAGHHRFNVNIHCYLVGSSFDSGHYIHNNLRISVIEYTYDLSGIGFKSHTGNWFRPDAKQFNFIKSLHNAEAIHGYR